MFYELIQKVGCFGGVAELAWGVLSRDVLSYIHRMDFLKFIVSYQKEEYITTQRVSALPVPIPHLV